MSNAIFGLIGVMVGALLTWVKESLHTRRERTQQARYLAIRVVCILDEFHASCCEIVGDDGTYHGQRTVDGDLQAQTSLPDGISFPDDVDWRAIDHFLMYRILSLPSRIKTDNDAISFIYDAVSCPPDYEEYFEERQYRYACLGLDVFGLAQEIGRKHNIPDRQLDNWDPIGELRDKKAEIEAQRKERAFHPALPPQTASF